MELVYLWVEEYKNIKEEGFNFSPRFTCNYDKDSNKLTIDENKEHVSIFPENINVTAIVGENGSGKSSIFKIIIYLFALCFEERKFELDAGGKYILVVKTKEGFRFLKNNFQDITCKEDLKKLTKRELNFYSIYVNYMMDSLKDGFQEDWVDEFYYRNDNYKTPILLEPNKNDNKIELDSLDYIAEQRFDWHFLVGSPNEVIQSFFNPSVVVIDVNIDKLISKLKHLNKASFDNKMFKYMTDQHSFLKDKTNTDLDTIFKQPIRDLEQEIGMLLHNKEYSKINTIYFALKILSTSLVEVDIFEELVKVVENDDLLTELIASVERRGLNSIYEEDIKDCEKLTFATKDKLRYCVDFQKIEKTISSTDLRNCIFKLEDKENYAEKLRSYPMWIKKTYYEGNNPPLDKTLARLSSGEKTYLKFLMMLVYEIEQISTNKEYEYETMNFFLDEIELSMHPNWQKRLFKDILQIFKNSSLKFNLIMSSHSPFILSDLPEENVIFLKDGKQKGVDINTFGANIHTLLSHGFFMEDGLMGEFAKGKITEIKTFYEENKDMKLEDDNFEIKKKDFTVKKKDFYHIKSIIGETFLKTIIKNYLDELEIIFYGKEEFLDKEIERLQNLKADLNDKSQI